MGLLSDLAAVGFARFQAAMQAHIRKSDPAPARLEAIGRGYVTFARTHPDLFLLMFRSERLDFTRPALRSAADAALDVLARKIPIDHPKLEKMAGDALATATVKRALSGVGVVIQSLGVSAGPEVILKPTRFFSKATRVLVTAMEETEVKRLICVTGFGAGGSRGHGGFVYTLACHVLLGRVYDDKDVQEWIVRRSKLDWVIV